MCICDCDSSRGPGADESTRTRALDCRFCDGSEVDPKRRICFCRGIRSAIDGRLRLWPESRIADRARRTDPGWIECNGLCEGDYSAAVHACGVEEDGSTCD